VWDAKENCEVESLEGKNSLTIFNKTRSTATMTQKLPAEVSPRSWRLKVSVAREDVAPFSPISRLALRLAEKASQDPVLWKLARKVPVSVGPHRSRGSLQLPIGLLTSGLYHNPQN